MHIYLYLYTVMEDSVACVPCEIANSELVDNVCGLGACRAYANGSAWQISSCPRAPAVRRARPNCV